MFLLQFVVSYFVVESHYCVQCSTAVSHKDESNLPVIGQKATRTVRRLQSMTFQ